MLIKCISQTGKLFSMQTYAILIILFLLLVNTSAEAKPVVCIIQISGDAIGPVSGQYIEQSIDQAMKMNAECLVIQLDTPGGLLESTHHIVMKILNAEIPIIVYVAPRGARAASAGTFITLASDIAVMAPGTTIGAASPVDMLQRKPSQDEDKNKDYELLRKAVKEIKKLKDKKTKEKESTKHSKNSSTPPVAEKDSSGGNTPKPGAQPKNVMMKKIENYVIAWVRSIAKLKNRNEEWAVKAVKDADMLTNEEALNKNVVDYVAENLDDLLKKIDGTQVKIKGRSLTLHTSNVEKKYLDMSISQRVLTVISNPNIVYFLFLIGMLGIVFEVTHPGAIFPGVVGTICLILAFFSLQVLPVNYAGVALILLAFILFILEVKITSYGLLSMGGLASLILGSIMLFDTDIPYMRVSKSMIFVVSLVTAIIFLLVVYAVGKVHRKKVFTGSLGLLDKEGMAETDIHESGTVRIHGEIWTAFSDSVIPSGSKVRVIEVDGLKVKVEKIQ